jgi:uncharacterized protein YbaA (DUF1428 family)
MNYIDGFLLPIAKDKLEAYQKVAYQAGEVWKEHGALGYWETVGDDLTAEGVVSFSDAAKCKENEVPIFAWIIYPSREARDQINAAVFADPRMNDMMDQNDPIFDCARMAYGGFKTIVCFE